MFNPHRRLQVKQLVPAGPGAYLWYIELKSQGADIIDCHRESVRTRSTVRLKTTNVPVTLYCIHKRGQDWHGYGCVITLSANGTLQRVSCQLCEERIYSSVHRLDICKASDYEKIE